MKTVIIVAVAVIVAVVIGVGGFFAGSAYGQSQAQDTRTEFFRNRQGGGQFGQNGQASGNGQIGQNGQGFQGGQFGRPVAAGTVKSVNGNTIVVTDQNGSTVTVTTDAQTTIQKTVTGTLSDIQPGERITVLSDQTGSNPVARTIQIRPSGQQ